MLHNIEAEQAVLGAALTDNRLVERVSLRAEHFYDPTHGAMWAEIGDRIRAGRVADLFSLKDFAARTFAQIGGVKYAAKLLDNAAPLTSQFVEYAAIIIECHARRTAKQALADALAAIEAGEDVLEAIATSEAALRSVVIEGDDEPIGFDEAGSRFLANIDRKALMTGLTALDARLGGLSPQELIILAGRPSMGKTALAAQVARNVAMAGGVVHFASLEMSAEQLARRGISAMSFKHQSALERIPYYLIRNGAPNIDRGALERWRSQLPHTMSVDERPAQTLAQLESRIRMTRRRHKRLDLVVVDYLQLMRASRNDGRVHEVTEISQGLKAIAKRLNVPVLALSQLSRGVEGRDSKKPTLSDLRDSGAIEQDADVVLACYREAYYLERAEPPPDESDRWAKWKRECMAAHGKLEIITLKQRQGPIGSDMFDAWLEYDTIRDAAA